MDDKSYKSSQSGNRLVREHDSLQQVELWSLVLQAVGIPHQISQGNQGFELLVQDDDLFAARQQLEIFDSENQDWPPIAPEQQWDVQAGADWLVVVLAAVLVFFYSVTGPWNQENAWFAQGAVHGKRIFDQGEWWRVITALFLHADEVHLLGNVVLGALLIAYLCQQLGFGVCLAMTVLSGALGNLLNVFFHGGNHHSVGFSTAVFGSLGCLCGLRLLSKEIGLRNGLLALGAGAALLAMLGTEGERTDLGAHLWGLVVGGVLGVSIAVTGRLQQNMLSASRQILVVLLSVAVVGVAWYAALYG